MKFLWELYATPEAPASLVSTAVLPALRRGARTVPGTVPQMWPYYTQLHADGWVTPHLAAEHICLAIFGMHQQGRKVSVHSPDVLLGEALRAVRFSGKFSEEALDRRFGAFATATQLGEVARHLESLINQMRAVPNVIGFNYTGLFWDLVAVAKHGYGYPDAAIELGRVRRRWGAQYFRTVKSENEIKE